MTVCHHRRPPNARVPQLNMHLSPSVTKRHPVTSYLAVTPEAIARQRLSSLSPVSLLKIPTLLEQIPADVGHRLYPAWRK
jgi:hypothetical protein